MSSDGIGEGGLAFEDFLSGRRESSEAPGRGSATVPPPATDEMERIRIVDNLRRILIHQLRSETTTVLPAGTTVRASGNVGEFEYLPDLVVDAVEWDGSSTIARQPLAVFEVGTTGSDRANFIAKWQVYRFLPTLNVYVFVDPEGVVATVWRRKGDRWTEEIFADADDQLFLPTIHALIPLTDVYAEAPPPDDGGLDIGRFTLG